MFTITASAEITAVVTAQVTVTDSIHRIRVAAIFACIMGMVAGWDRDTFIELTDWAINEEVNLIAPFAENSVCEEIWETEYLFASVNDNETREFHAGDYDKRNGSISVSETLQAMSGVFNPCDDRFPCKVDSVL